MTGERPQRQPVEPPCVATHARIRGAQRAEELVCADAQRLGQQGEVVEGKAPLARLEAAERGDIDRGAGGDGPGRPLAARPAPRRHGSGIRVRRRRARCALAGVDNEHGAPRPSQRQRAAQAGDPTSDHHNVVGFGGMLIDRIHSSSMTTEPPIGNLTCRSGK